MNREKQISLLNERSRILADISALDKVISQIATSGTASASLSSGGGSKTYSRIQLPELRAQRAAYARRVRAIERALAGRPAIGIGYAQIRRS